MRFVTPGKIPQAVQLEKRSWWRSAALVLSVAAVFVTTYALILPALTLDEETARDQGGVDLQTEETQAPEEAPASEEPAEAEEAKAGQTPSVMDGKISFEGKGYDVTAVCGEDAALPENTELTSEEITKDAKEYEGYYQEALKAVRGLDGASDKTDLQFARFYDISLTADGEKIEPSASVDVKLSFDKAMKVSDAENLRIVHFAVDEKTGKVKPEVLDSDLVKPTVKKDKMTAAEFEADSFSVYGVVYTVDFEYETDEESTDGSGSGSGKAEKKTYTYSIEGESSIKLSDLFEALHVKADAADAEKVTFTDEELVQGTQVEGDWELKSLKPFQTEEKLTVSMKDGSVIEIRVTDSRNVADLDELFSKADGRTKFVLWTESNGVAYALKRDGTTAVIDKTAIDSLDADFTWTIEYKYNSSTLQYYCVRPSDSDSSSLGLYIRDEYNDPPLVLPGTSEVNIRPKTDGNGGFEIEGWNNTKLVFDTASKTITSAQGETVTPVRIKITEQNKSKFTFRVASEDFTKGYVSGTDANNQNQQETAEYEAITKDNENKTNNNRITAVPRSPKYLFDYWDLNGTRLENGPTIDAGTLPIRIDGSVLTAHFRRNPDYEATDDEKEGRAIKRELKEWIENLTNQQVPLDNNATKKTAEVYDYENRIYRVDLATKSNLKTFDGTIDLGFSIDWSGSMNFPSKVKQVTGFKESEYSNNRIDELPLGHINDDYWHKTQWLDPNKTYFIITNRYVTADQFRIWYDTSETQQMQDRYGNWHNTGVWKFSMAYYTENISANSAPITPTATINHYDGSLENLTYAIYEEDSNGRLRRDDLRSSVESTVGHLNDILGHISVAKNSNDDPHVKIAWNDFHWQVPESHKTFQSVTDPAAAIDPQVITEGGTRADLGLEDALQFNWDPNSRKYMVLITDGAPQPSSGQRHADQGGWTDALVQQRTRDYAQQLKDQGITLLTIGLSMSDVKVGSVLLYDIASRDSVNEPYFYSAESGDELEYALYEILQTILKDATVIGDVTDTVNEAFYPVDKKTGEALTPSAGQAYYIDLNGNLIRDAQDRPVTTAPANIPYGKIEPSGNTYKVTWVDQEFKTGGWHGTIYEKAKEDFLGGNVVKTNSGEAEFQSKGYIVDGTNKYVEFNDETKQAGNKKLETPRVNVNDLNLTENNTEWTVYLGTEVDPKTQIQELYNNIKVEEVVSSAGDSDGDGLPDRITGTDHNYAYTESARDDRQTTGQPQTFYLKDLIETLPQEEQAKLDWDEIIRLSGLPGEANTGVTLKYGVYDQDPDNAGTINIKLTRDHDPAKHDTERTGAPVETYTLVVEFSPEYAHRPVTSGGDGKYEYHTGDYGLKEAGNVAGKDTSTNTHKINVFAKGLQITKVDPQDQILKGAKFTLYRSARDGETTGLKEIDGKQYFPVAELDTSSTGTAVKDPLEQLKEGEQYYLVETRTPAGYDTLAPMPVNIVIGNAYTPKPGSTTQKTKPASGIYDWTQTAAISLTSESGVKRTNADNTKDLTNTSVSVDSENEILYYRIVNNPGVELPKAGGPGTTWLYLLGSILVLLSGVVLIARRRIAR